MLNKILLCTDGSEQAKNAVRFGADLAWRHRARVDLVNVLNPVIVTGPSFLAPETGISEVITLTYAKDGQQALLKTAGSILDEAHVPYKSYAELGHPVDRIHCVAARGKADLIVIGSRGLSTWPALLLGSVSEGVTHHAPCPVLIVRGELKAPHRIVMASDGSAPATHAMRVGMELARDYDADVTVVNVFQPLAAPPTVTEDRLEPGDYAARVSEAIVAQADPIARDAGVPYQMRQLDGHSGEAIVEFASQLPADLIVVGSRGLGGFQRLLLGSVSSTVLHHAKCSVLVVR